GAAGGPEPALAVGEAGGGEAHLGVAEPLADAAEDGVVGYLAVLEDHLRVATREGSVGDLEDPLDPVARVVGVDQEHRRPGVPRERHADRERRPFGAGDEPLAAADRPARVG